MDGTAWAMAVHIITLLLWSASLFLLAALYAVPPASRGAGKLQRHVLMCRYLFVMLGSPAAVIAIISGCALVVLRGADGSWLLAKLAVVALLALYHAYCGHLLHAEEGGKAMKQPSLWTFPLLLCVPLVLISVIFILVLAKPDMVFEYQLTPQPTGHGDQGGSEQRQIQTTAWNGIQWIFQTG